MAIHELVDADTFQKVVLDEGAKSSDLILVDFVASWCGPCKVLSPILHRIAEDASQGISLVTVDVDQQPELAQAFQVTAMPTVISFKSGKVRII
jgi:thioredoxin 1